MDVAEDPLNSAKLLDSPLRLPEVGIRSHLDGVAKLFNGHTGQVGTSRKVHRRCPLDRPVRLGTSLSDLRPDLPDPFRMWQKSHVQPVKEGRRGMSSADSLPKFGQLQLLEFFDHRAARGSLSFPDHVPEGMELERSDSWYPVTHRIQQRAHHIQIAHAAELASSSLDDLRHAPCMREMDERQHLAQASCRDARLVDALCIAIEHTGKIGQDLIYVLPNEQGR